MKVYLYKYCKILSWDYICKHCIAEFWFTPFQRGKCIMTMLNVFYKMIQ